MFYRIGKFLWFRIILNVNIGYFLILVKLMIIEYKWN